jgi:hypothetical protein
MDNNTCLKCPYDSEDFCLYYGIETTSDTPVCQIYDDLINHRMTVVKEEPYDL